MPRKIRELEEQLVSAGFLKRKGKGSHRMWKHPGGAVANISGKGGDDAKRYQEREVEQAITEAKTKG